MADENRILGDIRPRTSSTDEDLDKSMLRTAPQFTIVNLQL